MEKKKTKLGNVELLKQMKKNGDTATPNENTYVATAQEQAMKGDTKSAMETMQYSVTNPAVKDISKQDYVRGADVSNQMVKNVQDRMKKRKAK